MSQMIQYQEGGGGQPEWLASDTLTRAMQFADALAKSEIVPSAYQKKAANVLVAIIVGRRLGLDPVAAMTALYVANGRAGLTADAMVALCKRHESCIKFQKVEESDDSVTWETQRRGSEPERCTITMAQAIAAGWAAKNPQYKTNPRRMLSARAKSFLCRDVYPDVLLGLKSREEIEDEVADEAERKKLAFEALKGESFAEKAKKRQARKGTRYEPTEEVIGVVLDEPEPEPEPEWIEPEPEPGPEPEPVPLRAQVAAFPDQLPDPVLERGRNAATVVANWSEFLDEFGRLTVFPRGSDAGKRFGELRRDSVEGKLKLLRKALELTNYENEAPRYGLEWLSPEELRAMDEACAAGLTAWLGAE